MRRKALQLSKRPNKINLVKILHNLKEDYSKIFHESIPKSPEMESVLIDAAKAIKNGNMAIWEVKNGVKSLTIRKYERRHTHRVAN